MLLPLFTQLEHRRRYGGVPAAVAYEQVLRRPDLLALHPEILNALTEEGGRDAVGILEGLRRDASEPAQHRLLQGVLMRLHTRTMEGRTRLPGSTIAHISSCDGQSTFFCSPIAATSMARTRWPCSASRRSTASAMATSRRVSQGPRPITCCHASPPKLASRASSFDSGWAIVQKTPARTSQRPRQCAGRAALWDAAAGVAAANRQSDAPPWLSCAAASEATVRSDLADRWR